MQMVWWNLKGETKGVLGNLKTDDDPEALKYTIVDKDELKDSE